VDIKELFQYLNALKRNNKRTWFHKNHERYLNLRKEFLTFTQDVISELAKSEPLLLRVPAKKCIFRIARDVRFSANKKPYKTHMAAAISRTGKKGPFAFYYFHLEPQNKSMIAGGIYMPEPPPLKQIRHLIDQDPYTLEEILNDKGFKKYFTRGLDPEQKLKTAPKGFAKDHPYIEYLKHKSFTVTRELSDSEVLGGNFKKEVARGFKILRPFNHYLDRHFSVYHS